jgi:ANTAR domain/PAS fold
MASPALSRDRIPTVSVSERRPAERTSGVASPAGRSVPAVRRLAGRYRYDVGRGTWWWSPEMFTLLGLPPESTEATNELLLQCLHQDDRARTLAAITGACTEGRPFTVRTRIVRADGQCRGLVLLGEPEATEGGDVIAVQGIAIDLTECAEPGEAPSRTAALEAEVGQMRAAMASRATIEQAKGILMLLTNCSDSVAFDLLAHISSHTHRKVRDVAESITESAAGHARLPDDVRAIVRDACPPSR